MPDIAPMRGINGAIMSDIIPMRGIMGGTSSNIIPMSRIVKVLTSKKEYNFEFKDYLNLIRFMCENNEVNKFRNKLIQN